MRTQLGDKAEWGYEHELLAVVADRVAHLTWLTTEIHKKEGASNPHPEPITRPGQRAQASQETRKALHKGHRQHSSIEDLKRFFGQPAGR